MNVSLTRMGNPGNAAHPASGRTRTTREVVGMRKHSKVFIIGAGPAGLYGRDLRLLAPC